MGVITGSSSCFLPGTLRDGAILTIESKEAALAGRYGVQGQATLAVRPERIGLAPPGTHPQERAVGRVDLATYLGAAAEHVVRRGVGLRVVMSGASSGAAAVPRLRVGEAVALCWPPDSERVFDAAKLPRCLLLAGAAGLSPPP